MTRRNGGEGKESAAMAENDPPEEPTEPEESPGTEPEGQPEPEGGNEPEGDGKPLGPKGEKALEEWKKRAKQAEKDAKRASELESELEQLRQQQMSEQEKAIEQARNEAAEQARNEVNEQVRRERLETQVVRGATGKLNDPDDAVRFLDLDDLADADAEQVTKAIDELLESKPYLAASATRPVGDADQGTRPEAGEPDPSQMDPATYLEWRRKRRAS